MVIAEYNFTQQEIELLKEKNIHPSLCLQNNCSISHHLYSIVSTSQTGAVQFLFMLPL